MSILKFLPLSIFILFYNCQSPLPENIDAVFADWFINGNIKAKKELSRYKLTAEELNAIGKSTHSGKIKTGKQYFVLNDRDGTEHTLGFSTPPDIIKDSLYPLLIYLHGGIGTAKKDKGKFAYDMFTFITDTVDIFLASPSGNKNAPWWSQKGINRILQSIRYMTLNFPIDPDRIILAGVSDGAAGCYVAANTYSSPFAGFIAISGFGGILPQLGIMLNPTNLMQRPIYNINAGKDNHYKAELVEQFLSWLNENNVTIKSKIYPDEEHGFDYKLKEKTTLIELINKWRKPVSNNICWTIVPNIPNLTDNILSWDIAANKKDSHIITYWKNDILNINSNGINSFLMITDKTNSDKLYYKTKNGAAKPIKPMKQSTELQLDLMKNACYPTCVQKNVISITL